MATDDDMSKTARELKIESVRAERRAQKKRLEQRQESEQEQKIINLILQLWDYTGGAWPFLVGGLPCQVDSGNERDLSLLNSQLRICGARTS